MAGRSFRLVDNLKNGKRYPSIDLGHCSDCRGCIEIAPRVFRYNPSTGLMEIIDMQVYPADLVDEAIKNCPRDCIFWER